MDAETARNPLERFLNIFTEVREGEAASALLLTGILSMPGRFWFSQRRHWAKDCWCE